MDKATEYAKQRSKAFQDALKLLEIQGNTVRPRPLTEKQLEELEENEDTSLVNGFGTGGFTGLVVLLVVMSFFVKK